MKLIITENQYKKLIENNNNELLHSQLLKDKETINLFSSKYPQWDFTKAIIRRETKPNGQPQRFLDGLYCDKHKLTNDNINVDDLRRRGSGCRECGKDKQNEGGWRKRPLEQWVIDLNNADFETKIENFEYIPNKNGKPILSVKDAICKKCGEKIDKYLNVWNMKSGKSKCPVCSVGKWEGEETIAKILDDKEINNIPKYQFTNLKGKEFVRRTPTGGVSKATKLPYYFDFYLPELNTLIEYDGEYHFHVKKGRHDEIKLSDYIKRDLAKNDYAKDKFKLIRISYHDKKDMVNQLEKGLESPDELWLSDNYPQLGWNQK